jgi:hypothetical protein
MPHGPKGASLRIRLPYRSETELLSGLGRNLTRTSLFVATEVVRPTGTIVSVEVLFADGGRVLGGEAVVARERARRGMLLNFLSLDEESRALLDRVFFTPAERAERLVLGVDPGTTSTRIALAIDGRPGLVTHADGEGRSSTEALHAALLDAQAKLAVPATRAILAVPAYFTERQRAESCQLATRAGWRVEQVTSAPAALAIAYSAGRSLLRHRLCVVDFGVSKLDVAIVEVEGDDADVVACGGDAAFGAASPNAGSRLDRLEQVVRGVLSGARLTPRAIDDLVLGGGMAHLPEVRERLSTCLGRTPPDDLDPRSAVAFGAALLGESYAQDGAWRVNDLVPEEPAGPTLYVPELEVETAGEARAS